MIGVLAIVLVFDNGEINSAQTFYKTIFSSNMKYVHFFIIGVYTLSFLN